MSESPGDRSHLQMPHVPAATICSQPVIARQALRSLSTPVATRAT